MNNIKSDLEIRPILLEDREWISQILTQNWGAHIVISRGQMHDASKLPGFIAMHQGARAGLITYRIDGNGCEIVTLDSWQENIGVGTNLIEAVKQEALKAGCVRLWLITTNDNLHALRFYQKRDFQLVAVHPNALAESRKIKPSIPETGMHGIPLRDEIELEIQLV
jgi:ribosomal protein S18 acetylase RimI-like enzyme